MKRSDEGGEEAGVTRFKIPLHSQARSPLVFRQAGGACGGAPLRGSAAWLNAGA